MIVREIWTARDRESNLKDVNLTGNPAVAFVLQKADDTIAALGRAFDHVYDCAKRDGGRKCRECAAAWRLYQSVVKGA